MFKDSVIINIFLYETVALFKKLNVVLFEFVNHRTRIISANKIDFAVRK